MTQKIQLGKQIKRFRKEAGLTQEQLAEAMDVSVGAVSKWESDSTIPELAMLIKLAKLFEVSVDVLLHYQVENTKLQESMEQADDLLRGRKFKESLELLERLRLKYPNDFKLIHYTANAYFYASMESEQKTLKRRYCETSLRLLERSLELIKQNTDPRTNEREIKVEMSRVLQALGQTDKAVEILEAININEVFSSQIAAWLSLKENPTDQEIDKMKSHMEIAFLNASGQILNTAMVYLNYYLSSHGRNLKLAQSICQLALGYLDSIIEEGQDSYFDRIRIPFLTGEVFVAYLEGREEEAKQGLQETLQLARSIDAHPTFSLAIPYLTKHDKSYAFDNFGSSMEDFLENLLQDFTEESYGPQARKLQAYWKQLRTE